MSQPMARDLDRLRAGERPSPQNESLAVRREHAAWRAEISQALLADLQPGDHALAVWLLEGEIADIAAGLSAGSSETLYRLVAAVARFAQPEDALLIWRAAQATPETREGVDVEQALRAGPDAVVRALQRRVARGGAEADEARETLAWVGEGIANGAASDLPAYFAWSDERFGLHVSGPT